jgi:hypothetical protein
MKIGMSFSRCIRDIVQGTVDINDVLIVISGTDLDPRDDRQWHNVWQGYRERNGWSPPEWTVFEDSDEDQVRSVAIELYETGRLHQPRQYGHRTKSRHTWLDTIVLPVEMQHNPAVLHAWQQFQIVAGLTNATPDTPDISRSW